MLGGVLGWLMGRAYRGRRSASRSPPRNLTLSFESGAFAGQGRLGVAIGGVQVGMPQPTADDGHIDPCSHQMNRGGMSKDMGVTRLVASEGACLTAPWT
jgi:hypothetical protein